MIFFIVLSVLSVLSVLFVLSVLLRRRDTVATSFCDGGTPSLLQIRKIEDISYIMQGFSGIAKWRLENGTD